MREYTPLPKNSCLCLSWGVSAIALLENNYNEDGTVTIPKVLRPYMGNKERI